jgi:hypothetical protein
MGADQEPASAANWAKTPLHGPHGANACRVDPGVTATLDRRCWSDECARSRRWHQYSALAPRAKADRRRTNQNHLSEINPHRFGGSAGTPWQVDQARCRVSIASSPFHQAVGAHVTALRRQRPLSNRRSGRSCVPREDAAQYFRFDNPQAEPARAGIMDHYFVCQLTRQPHGFHRKLRAEGSGADHPTESDPSPSLLACYRARTRLVNASGLPRILLEETDSDFR